MNTALFWSTVSRLGEAQILLPAALALCCWLALRHDARPLARRWLGWIAVAAGVTTVTKLAFIGWGIGNARLDFTGISGHAMFAAAVYPPLFRLMAAARPAAWQRAAWAAGAALALLIAGSRVMVGAHSWSEVAAGVLVGGLVSGSALWMARMRHPAVPWWMPALVGAWLVVTPAQAPASTTHDMVTRLALTLSGRPAPYTRADLLRGTPPRTQLLGAVAAP
jgi:membrane-associated phospholipid phosphatase